MGRHLRGGLCPLAAGGPDATIVSLCVRSASVLSSSLVCPPRAHLGTGPWGPLSPSLEEGHLEPSLPPEITKLCVYNQPLSICRNVGRGTLREPLVDIAREHGSRSHSPHLCQALRPIQGEFWEYGTMGSSSASPTGSVWFCPVLGALIEGTLLTNRLDTIRSPSLAPGAGLAGHLVGGQANQCIKALNPGLRGPL